MKNLMLSISLLMLAGIAPLQAQCKVAATGISAIAGGYAVTLPAQVRSAVPTSEPLRLVLRDAAGNVSSVAGPVRTLASGQLWIQTADRFTSSPTQCPSKAVLQKATLSDASCLDAELGIGCFLTWCAGQTYCLPGNGPGGFDCRCV